jgi:hypothetical protein
MGVGKSWLVLGVVLVLSGFTDSARAQSWLSDRARAEGAGIRVGDFELHPGVGAEVGYDSNVFLSDVPQDSAVLRIAPHLFISTLGAERSEGATQQRKLTLRAGVNGSIRHWFATHLGTGIGASQVADLTWRPGGSFSLNLNETFSRTVEPFTDPGAPSTGVAASRVKFGRDRLGVGARAQLATRSEVLRAGLGYRIEIDHFEASEFADNRTQTHAITADTSWGFLPKTALFWDGTLSFQNFSSGVGVESGAVSVRNDSTTVRNRMGINGALTSTLGFTLAAGYGASFFADDRDSETVIGQAEARWDARENLQLSLGYDRVLTPAYQGNFLVMNRFRTALRSMFGGTLVVTARAELSLLDYGVDPIQGEREDTYLLGALAGEYRIADWLAFTADLTYVQTLTDFVFVSGTGAEAVRDPADFQRFEAMFGVRAFL